MPNSITATPSYYQDQLSRDERFRRRIQQHLMNQALVVMAEALNVPNHTERIAYAKLIVADGAESFASRAAFVIVNHASINTTINIADGNITTSITDVNLLAAINSMWNTLAGVPSGI